MEPGQATKLRRIAQSRLQRADDGGDNMARVQQQLGEQAISSVLDGGGLERIAELLLESRSKTKG